jgi:hypothetical protein
MLVGQMLVGQMFFGENPSRKTERENRKVTGIIESKKKVSLLNLSLTIFK